VGHYEPQIDLYLDEDQHLILPYKAFVPTRIPKLSLQMRNCYDIKMSAPMLSMLAEEFYPQYLKLIDRLLDGTILGDVVVAEVWKSSNSTWKRAANLLVGGSVLAFQRDPAAPDGSRQVSIHWALYLPHPKVGALREGRLCQL